MTLGERLKELRQGRHWTQADLSKRCGLTAAYLSQIESGARRPSLDALVGVARAFEMSLPDVLLDVDEWGEMSAQALPAGLADLIQDPEIGPELTPEWVSTLSRIELAGQRPTTKRGWLELYLSLKRILVKDAHL